MHEEKDGIPLKDDCGRLVQPVFRAGIEIDTLQWLDCGTGWVKNELQLIVWLKTLAIQYIYPKIR